MNQENSDLREKAALDQIKESETYKIAIALGWLFDLKKMRFGPRLIWEGQKNAEMSFEDMERWLVTSAGREAMRNTIEEMSLRRELLYQINWPLMPDNTGLVGAAALGRPTNS